MPLDNLLVPWWVEVPCYNEYVPVILKCPSLENTSQYFIYCQPVTTVCLGARE